MNDLNCTFEQKLKGAIYLLRDEAYQLWLTVEEGTQLEQLTWDYFQSAFQNKYVGASYVKAHRHKFLGLTQGDRSMAEYEVKFFKLSRYACSLVATNYNKSVLFEEGFKYDHKVLIAPQREQVFKAFFDKVKIVEVAKVLSMNRGRGERVKKITRGIRVLRILLNDL